MRIRIMLVVSLALAACGGEATSPPVAVQGPTAGGVNCAAFTVSGDPTSSAGAANAPALHTRSSTRAATVLASTFPGLNTRSLTKAIRRAPGAAPE